MLLEELTKKYYKEIVEKADGTIIPDYLLPYTVYRKKAELP